MNKRELKMLEEKGFELERDYEFDMWSFEEWGIRKDREEVNNLIDNYLDGYRICLMNIDDDSYGKEYILGNISDDGIWICESLKECFEIVEHCDDEDWDWNW